jgi:hypothetical protein
MTKLIAAVIIAAVLYGGWELFFYWERVKNEEEEQKKKAVAVAVQPEQLSGMSPELDNALRAAQNQGAEGLRNFLKAYGNRLQDPRKAWIELDYCQMVARENTAEAKRVFAEVKRRTPHNSPIWPRIQQLEKTYD